MTQGEQQPAIEPQLEKLADKKGEPDLVRPNKQILQKRRSTLATLPSLPMFPHKWTPKLASFDETGDIISEENETDEIISGEEKPSYDGAKRRSSMPAIFHHWEPKVGSLSKTMNSFLIISFPSTEITKTESLKTFEDNFLKGSRIGRISSC